MFHGLTCGTSEFFFTVTFLHRLIKRFAAGHVYASPRPSQFISDALPALDQKIKWKKKNKQKKGKKQKNEKKLKKKWKWTKW